MERSKKLVLLARQAAQARELSAVNIENTVHKDKDVEIDKQILPEANLFTTTQALLESSTSNINEPKNMDDKLSTSESYPKNMVCLMENNTAISVSPITAQILEDIKDGRSGKTYTHLESVPTTSVPMESMEIDEPQEKDIIKTDRPHMRKRWKKADESTWDRNIQKKNRKNSMEYVSTKGKKQLAKIPKMVDCNTCRYKCTTKFSEEERNSLCSKYWNLSFERQKDFILLNVKMNTPIRRRSRSDDSNVTRTQSRKYSFVDGSGTTVQTCQNFFFKTLCISNNPVINAFKNIGSNGQYDGKDKRGQNTPGNKTSDEMKERVIEHIKSFPVMESHYSRKSTKRQYLDANLSITKMYSLYKEKCEQDNQQCVSEITYRRIFGTNFNLSFFVPKKDQCMLCKEYEKASTEEKSKIEGSYKEHLERKTLSMIEKEKDKKRASEDKEFKTVTCDLQSVLQIPSSAVSLLYYLRKINLYNFTVYEANPPNNAFCYFWTELNGKRGSSEIGTCLSFYLKSLTPDTKHITIFSDTCGGQNRNIQVSALLVYTVINHPSLNVIEQKFLESGHSFMEVDSMHSAIEKAKKHIEIFSVHEMQNIFKMARSKAKGKLPYNTQELQFNDFLDLKNLVQSTIGNRKKDDDGNDVNWLKIKCLRYAKQFPDIIQYKYGYNDEYKNIAINSSSKKRLQKTALKETSIMPLYSKQLPISVQKKNDLLKLCRQNVIPQELRQWYENLPTSSTARDFIDDDISDDKE